MEEMWKNSAIIAKRNVDDNQNPISVQLYELKPVIDVHSCIVLNQLPDEFQGVEIEGFTQVYDVDKISTNNFKVDYANGVLYFHPNNIGKMLTINYYGTGYTLLSASRIYTKYDKDGNVLETLEELIDKAKLYLEAIESLGGAVEVINKLNIDIEAGATLDEELKEDIKIGTEVKEELVEKIDTGNTTINTLVQKTNAGNETVSQLNTANTTATQKKQQLDQSIAQATDTNETLTNTNQSGIQTNLTLQQTIATGQDSVDKINATGNKSLIIGASEFVNNEYTWTHNMNSEELHITMYDVNTKEPLMLDCKPDGENKLIIRNSTEHPNIKVVLSASYYQGNTLFGTNVEEFANDSITAGAKKVRLKDGNGVVENPITDSDAVFMTDGTTKLTKKISDIDASLAKNKNQTDIIISNSRAKKTKACLTLMSDDGQVAEFTKYRQFCIDNNVKTGLAIIPEALGQTNFLTKDQLKTLIQDGHYIVGHGLTRLTDLTQIQIESNFKNCIALGEELGQKITQYAYPEGVSNGNIRRTVRKYFDCAYGTGGTINITPISTTNIRRPMFGSYEILEADTLAEFKSIIDSAIVNDAWVVLCMHSGSTTEQRWLDLAELIAYCRLNNVDIILPNEGWERFGNIIDTTCEDGDGNSFVVANDGKIKSTNNLDSKVIVREYSGVTNATLLNDNKFKSGYCTIDNFLFADNSGFPSGAGTLTTYKPNSTFDMGCGYQTWIPYGSSLFYFRTWNQTSKTWNPLQKLSQNTTQIDGMDGRNLTDAITTYDNGKITYTPISSARASSQGFPANKAGMLITERIYGENGFQRQMYKIFNEITEYERIVDTSGSWGEFSRIARIFPSTVNIASTTVNANSVKEIDITVSGVLLGDVVFAQPNQVLEDNVSWSCHVYTTNTVKLRICNPTTSSIALASRDWRFTKLQYR